MDHVVVVVVEDLVLLVQGMDHVVVAIGVVIGVAIGVVVDRIVIHDVKISNTHRVMPLLLLILVGVM